MRDRKLNRLFARWRERGDAEALGEVFDLTAPELLRVALHVVRDPAEADDLLQATYLTAIERSASFDASEPLVPWLVGVLVRHAHESRRKRERTPDEARLATPRVDDPHETAVNSELSAELRKALGDLPERDRAVLIPFLYEGKRAVEIAAHAGQPAGTVRMQIHRGLDRLRKALPAGLSLGVAATFVGGRGLAAVRAELLRHAALSTPIAAGAAAGLAGTLTLGGLVVTKKLALAAVALALVLAAGWWMRSMSESPAALDSARPVASLVPPAAEAAETAAPVLDSAAQETSRVEAAPANAPAIADERFQAALAGVTGRLLHSDARAAADVEVSLLEVRTSFFARSLREALDANEVQPELLVSRTRTDAEGRFKLDGARALAMHGLGIDLGGSRASLRVLDRALRPGESTDLGDVVLNPSATLVGRVVDESGSPIAGARVRATAAPQEMLAPGIEQYRSGAYIVLCEASPSVFEVPAWISSTFERLPIPTARTDASGAFRLDGVPEGSVTALVDTDGRPVRLIAVGKVAVASTTDLRDIALERGVTAHGRVLDSTGAPIAGADVAVGAGPAAEQPKGRGFIMAYAAGRTDAEGRFECSGLPSNGPACVLARASSVHAWTIVRGLAVASEIEVRLPATFPVHVRLRDDAGESVTPVELWLTSDSIDSSGLLSLVGMRRIASTASERDHASVELPALPRGRYVLAGRAAGCAPARVPVNVVDAAVDVELVFTPARMLNAQVRERATGTPIAGADVSVLADKDVACLARARTGPDGKVVLDGVPRRASKPLSLRVEHPGFATLTAPLDTELDEAVLELELGGELLAHVRDAGEVPRRSYLFLVTASVGSELDREIPILATTDERGDARMARLSPGKYRYQLVDPWFDQEVVALPKRYQQHSRGDFAIESGSTTEVTIDLRQRTDNTSGAASIEGRVTIDGLPAASLTMRCGAQHTETDARGDFHLGGLRAGTQYLIITRRGTNGGTEVLHGGQLELGAGERRMLAFDWRSIPVDVEVRGPQGELAADVFVTIHPSEIKSTGLGSSTKTDALGRARLAALKTGPHTVEAVNKDVGAGNAEVAVVDGGATPLATVTLARYAPCAGRLVVPSGASKDGNGILHCISSQGFGNSWCSCVLEQGRAAFELTALVPGKYQAWWNPGLEEQLGPLEFELPVEGNLQLVLEFSQEQRPRKR